MFIRMKFWSMNRYISWPPYALLTCLLLHNTMPKWEKGEGENKNPRPVIQPFKVYVSAKTKIIFESTHQSNNEHIIFPHNSYVLIIFLAFFTNESFICILTFLFVRNIFILHWICIIYTTIPVYIHLFIFNLT